MNYKEQDIAHKYMMNIIKLGKWAFSKIPEGEKCNGCPLLQTNYYQNKTNYACSLDNYTGICLCHSGDNVFKKSDCPNPNQENKNDA